MIVLRFVGELIFLLLMPLAVLISMLALPGSLLVLAGPLAWLVVNALVVLLGASAGAFAAAYWAELRRGADPHEARRAGWGGVVGRVLALAARVAITAAMAALATISVLFPAIPKS